MSCVCHPHADKMADWAILYARCLRTKFIRILIWTTRIAPTLFNLFHFLSAYAMRILIRRRGKGAYEALLTIYNIMSILLQTYVKGSNLILLYDYELYRLGVQEKLFIFLNLLFNMNLWPLGQLWVLKVCVVMYWYTIQAECRTLPLPSF